MNERSKESLRKIMGLSDIDHIEGPITAATEWDYLMTLEKIINEQKEALRPKLFAYAETEGAKDEKGSFMLKLPTGQSIKKEARVTVKLNTERAEALARNKGLSELFTTKYMVEDDNSLQTILRKVESMFPEEIQIKEVLDETSLEQAVIEGKVTDEEFQSIIDKNVTYALKVNKN